MIEIKFRAWSKKHKKMSKPFSFYDIHYDGNIFPEAEDWYLVECDVVRYTGLKDKNGKEIYEGDIVSWNEKELKKSGKEKVIGTVVYWIAGFTIETDPVYYSLCGRYSSIEVIGHIFENPELIK